MFDKEIQDKLQAIFGIDKVTFDQPSDAREQNCIFVEIESTKNSIKDGKAVAMVTANCTIYGQREKIPFGFISKRIQKADHALTKDFFFQDLETNSKIYQNLVQRTFSFIYFFTSQYDPEIGTITSIDITVEET